MRLIVKQDKKGFTLVEVMISLTILLFVFLALMQTALVSIDANMGNLLRDEAVSIAMERITAARTVAFANLTGDTAVIPGAAAVCPPNFNAAFANGVLFQRSFRNITVFNFCTNMTVAPIGNGQQINIEVWWLWKDAQISHRVSTIRHPLDTSP